MDDDLLNLEKKYCSYGDTVHYAEYPKVFSRCEGSYMYDENGDRYLDLQMWYSAVNLGYGNKNVNDAVKKQIDTLPQIASQYLHKGKIELATKICTETEKRFGKERPRYF